MTEQELAHWQAQYEQSVVITCEPDPDHDLDAETLDWYDEIRQATGA